MQQYVPVKAIRGHEALEATYELRPVAGGAAHLAESGSCWAGIGKTPASHGYPGL